MIIMGRTLKISCKGMDSDALAQAIADGAKITSEGVEMPDGSKVSNECKIKPPAGSIF